MEVIALVRFPGALAAILAAALLFVACTSDPEPPPPTETPATTTPATPAPTATAAATPAVADDEDADDDHADEHADDEDADHDDTDEHADDEDADHDDADEHADDEDADHDDADEHADDEDADHDDADEHADDEDADDDHADDDHADDDHAAHDNDDDTAKTIVGRLLVADAAEAHLSVIDLSTDKVDSGAFEVAAPGATVYSSPTNRYAIVLARGPEADDDRIHVFDGRIYLVEHGDHFDLIRRPVRREALEIAEEWPVHYVNSHGWTAIFADTNGHVILINEQDLVRSRADYEPIVLEAGFQHGAALVVSDDHVIVSTNNPACTEFIPSGDCLPVGVEVRTFDNEVVYDAANNACPGLHGESHNAHGAVFGCFGGVLFVHSHDGEYEHELIPYPAETGGEVALGLFYGHHRSDNFFAPATLFPGGECCDLGGVWLVDVLNGEMREVFPEPSAAGVFSSDGETFYMLAADGMLRAFDAHDGELIGTRQVVDPFEIVFGSPSPAMVVVDKWLYIADPNSGQVLGFHVDHAGIKLEWEVGGAPSSLAFVGVIQ